MPKIENMSAYDLIIVGLGPAGSALGHRAHARGLRVLGLDPTTKWPATYGIFADELPSWLVDAPCFSRSFPLARALRERQINRQYCILDNEALRTRLQNFPIIRDPAEIRSSNSVMVAGKTLHADVVVDARGFSAAPGTPVQQAAGQFTREEGPDLWMDFSGATGRFTYSFATPSGRLVEDTVLAAAHELPWDAFGDADERVLIPLGPPPASAALPYGARAGFINPMSGYSLGTSLSFADPTLDALWPSTPTRRPLPWRTRTFRADRALCTLLQRVLIDVPPATLLEIMNPILVAPIDTQRAFLQLGNLLGTVRGMVHVFAHATNCTRIRIVRALLRGLAQPNANGSA